MPPTPSHGRHHRPQRPSALPHLPDVNDVRVTIDDGMEYAVIISMYEVYNDRIFDLLSSSSHSGPPNSRADKDLRRRPLLFKSTEYSPDRKVVAGLRKIICGSLAEALMVLEAGLLERRVAGTGSNSVSSRSHGFFCVEVKRRRKASSSTWNGSTLTVVDLAGSERARNAKTAGATLAEAGKINESLMYLGQCLQMQSDNSDGHKSSLVPFRQCKLTELLFSNSFPSASSTSHHHTSTHHAPQKAIMIVTADPLGDFNATSQILRYSALAREITVPRVPSLPSSVLSGMHARGDSATSGRTTPNSPPSAELEYAAQEIARLSEELDVMTFRLADEEKRRIDAESAWQAADERCLQIEQEVREQCSAEMEKRMDVEMRRWKGAWGEEADRNDEHMDKKLGILTQSIYIHEDVESPSTRRTRELEDENDALRRRVNQLEHELHGRSPTRKSRFSSLAATPRQSMMDVSTNDVENTRPILGEKLLFPTSPSKSPRRSSRKPLQDTTTTTSPFVQPDEPSYIESDASLLSQQTDQSHDGEAGSENWAVIGSGRSTMSAFGQTVAGLDQLSLSDTSSNWTTTKTIRTPTKTPRKNAMTMLSSSPVVMDETTLRETGSAVKKAKTAKTPGTGRKVRKLTTRKWDLADEEELSC